MLWIEIEISSRQGTVWVAARGSRGERARIRELGIASNVLTSFRIGVGNAIARVQSLEGKLLAQAHALHDAIFSHELRDLYIRLSAAATDQKQHLLVRLMIEDPALQALPWEAACRPQTQRGFLASAADVIVTRGVHSTDPWQPRELRRALRILPVLAIPDRSALDGLELLLREHVETGAVDLLPAIEGDAARNPILFERLREGPSPHVLHFLGHGGFDRQRTPVVRLADDANGEPSLLPIEVFAEELRANFDSMRLIYLQACSGARPGVFASAAELLVNSGVDAVVAHLWPVRSEIARAAAQDFYRHLIGARRGQGDVGVSVQASRRTLVAESADAFSPVLYLRGPDSRLFDVEDRRLRPPRKSTRAPSTVSDDVPPALARLLNGPFSLILGESWDDDSVVEINDRIRQALADALGKLGEADTGSPLHTMAQRYRLHAGRLKLTRLFQKVLYAARELQRSPALVDTLALHLRPGVHTTLLWLPLLEHAIARHHPDYPLYVIQPGLPGHEDHRIVMVREPGSDEWQEIDELPELRLDEAFVVLRLYGGYSPEEVPVLMSPQLTEDDHIQGLFQLRYIIPSEWETTIMGRLRTHPVLCIGVSALEWRHRMLLRWLFDQRPPPTGSLVVLAESQLEDEIWHKRGAGIPGTSHFAAVHVSMLNETLQRALP